jgi:1-phosphofructokinase family hexose kinase
VILCVGLTPTVQRTMFFSALSVGEVNRAIEVLTTASGKAVNVARVIATLGEKHQALLIHPLGGDSGRLVERLLILDGVRQEILWDAPTRLCTTILESSGRATELVEEANALTFMQVEALITLAAAQHHATALCLSGSLPKMVGSDFYVSLMRALPTLPTIIDAQKEPLRRTLTERPYLVKPNRSEAIAALGLSQTASALDCARALIASGAQNALVSEGAAGSVLVTENSAWRIIPPQDLAVVNPIGSGDSLTGGIAFARFIQNKSLLESVCFGTACAAANCISKTSGVIDPAAAQQFLLTVQHHQL